MHWLFVTATFIILYCCNIKLHASFIVISISLSTTSSNWWCIFPIFLPHLLQVNPSHLFSPTCNVFVSKPKQQTTHIPVSLCAGAHCDGLRLARGDGHRRQPPRRTQSRRAQCARPAGTQFARLPVRALCVRVVRQRDLRSKPSTMESVAITNFIHFPTFQ